MTPGPHPPYRPKQARRLPSDIAEYDRPVMRGESLSGSSRA
jgi:hypothetical protein